MTCVPNRAGREDSLSYFPQKLSTARLVSTKWSAVTTFMLLYVTALSFIPPRELGQIWSHCVAGDQGMSHIWPRLGEGTPVSSRTSDTQAS